MAQADNLDCVPLQDEHIYVAVPDSWEIPLEDGRISLDSLLDRPMLYLANPKNAGVLVMQNKPLQSKVMVSSDGDTILSMIQAEMGFSLLSRRFSADCPEGVSMYPADPPITRTIGVAALSQRELSPLTRRFVRMLREDDVLN